MIDLWQACLYAAVAPSFLLALGWGMFADPEQRQTALGNARTLYRHWWYAVTGRMPRYRGPLPEPDRPLSDEDRGEFGGLTITFREDTLDDCDDKGRRARWGMP